MPSLNAWRRRLLTGSGVNTGKCTSHIALSTWFWCDVLHIAGWELLSGLIPAGVPCRGDVGFSYIKKNIFFVTYGKCCPLYSGVIKLDSDLKRVISKSQQAASRGWEGISDRWQPYIFAPKRGREQRRIPATKTEKFCFWNWNYDFSSSSQNWYEERLARPFSSWSY